jgi:putative ABC transport system ATP-binding protein
MPEVIATINGIAKDYQDGLSIRRVLYPTTLDILSEQFTVIIGPSGSGKTTFLSIVGLIVPPTEGSVSIRGEATGQGSEDDIATFRLKSIGFVFQNSTLMDALNVMDNILLPIGIQGGTVTQENREKAQSLLKRFNLDGHAYSMPTQLSGGEKQRVAIIRALINDPPLILCDEPTSVLDMANVEIVLETLKELSREPKRAVVMITHDPRAIKYADRVIEIESGHLKFR